MGRTVAACWKCGAPNSLVIQRTQQIKRQQEMDQTLGGFPDPARRTGRGRSR
jgi:hypothetical protein